jgi:predicted outer membrane protein
MTLKRHTAISIGILIIGITFGYLLNEVCNDKETYRPQAQVQNHSMHGEMNDMMKGLEGKTGDEFDKAFLKEMIVHHEER